VHKTSAFLVRAAWQFFVPLVSKQKLDAIIGLDQELSPPFQIARFE
jgi:hypothetical protein